MRRLFLTAMSIILTAMGAMAMIDNDERAIKYEELPAEARSFIAKHFPNEQPSYTIEDREFTHTEYKVVMASGVKIEFDGDGKWTEVDCRYTKVPEAIVPKKIADYVKANYPTSKIFEITKERNEWEVKITGGLELTFDSALNLIDIDD
ncbi:MAG: PepSY-like domain-containing protein [Alistipes sp.]|nr:PepSY-like domain-containing protein [Alistipes sp.]